ncbi:MAG: hypothetical protein GY711_24965 [bacterium]|nr:hypothetical protein [bacterium]
MRNAARVSLTLALAGAAHAQVSIYDAGTAGNPPVAPDPVSQGWSVVGTPGHPISPDAGSGINAWEVADNSVPGFGFYQQWINTSHLMNVGWELTVTMRVTAGPPNGTIMMEFSTGQTAFGDSRWALWFEIQGNDVLAINIACGGGVSIYVCPGGADGGYHTYTLRDDTPALFSNADFLYDGVFTGIAFENYPDLQWSQSGPRWGADDRNGLGRARFHRVELRALDDLGSSYCGPAAPNSTGGTASITAFGSPYAASSFLELTASGLPPGQFGYFLAGRTQGSFMPPGSQGTICLSGNIGRFNQPSLIIVGPTGTIPVDLTAIPVNPPESVAPGDVWRFQCWYRDANPGQTSNFTDGVEIEFR